MYLQPFESGLNVSDMFVIKKNITFKLSNYFLFTASSPFFHRMCALSKEISLSETRFR
jgi:hypothetical protein